MNTTVISTINGITLVTLQSSPANVTFVSDVFERISERDINIDMISMAPTHGAVTSLSFTIDDDDLIKMLGFTAELKKEMDIKAIISSVNHKIAIHDPKMKNTPGMASRVFTAIKNSNADIRLITTSEVEISLLVSEADYDDVLAELKKEFAD
ncbi:MAG: ACT domain-containing protein [Clostridia bacterium]|nr:ACT domain-containing protein [Clostridia bacterium]